MKTKTNHEWFAERLSEYMTERKLSQRSLALQTNIPRSTIKDWFHGVRPSIDSITILAKFFKCTTDYLLGLEDEFGNKVY